jgi:putative tryptophan/tyrosine transport system substrate-binding protein
MKRRTFVAGLAATAGFPSAALAQAASSVPEIALFYTGPMVSAEARAKMVRDDLGTAGFVDGKSFVVSITAGKNNSEELTKLATSLIRPSVKVILAIGPGAVKAAQAATTTIPIVAVDLETDPVKEGFAQSLAHPGGNLTGLFFDFPEFSGKLLELLNEARPGLVRVAALWDPASGSVQIEAAQAAAASRGMKLQTLSVEDLSKLSDVLSAAQTEKAEGLIVLSSPLFSAISGIKPVAEQVTAHGLPAVTLFPEFAQNGGLMGYGPSLDDLYHQASDQIARVLRGEKAGDLPLQRPSRFRLIINLKAAKQVGLQLPSSLVARADEVIE